MTWIRGLGWVPRETAEAVEYLDLAWAECEEDWIARRWLIGARAHVLQKP